MNKFAVSLVLFWLASCASTPQMSGEVPSVHSEDSDAVLTTIGSDEFSNLAICPNYWRDLVSEWKSVGGRISPTLGRTREDLANSDSRLGAIFRETWQRQSNGRDGKEPSEYFMDLIQEESPECSAPFWLATVLAHDDVAFPLPARDALSRQLEGSDFPQDWPVQTKLIYFLIDADASVSTPAAGKLQNAEPRQ